MKRLLKIIVPLMLILVLASCASQPLDPVEVIDGFYKASSENRVEDAFSYLAEDVGLALDSCRYGDDARANLREVIEDSDYQMEWVGGNYRVDGDQVLLDVKILSNGELLWEDKTTFVIQDGLIQWQGDCLPQFY